MTENEPGDTKFTYCHGFTHSLKESEKPVRQEGGEFQKNCS
jgi:hypothetical protein